MNYNNNRFPIIVGISSIYMHLCLSYKQDKHKFVTKEKLSQDANITNEFIDQEIHRLVERGMSEVNSKGEFRAVEPPEKIFSIAAPISVFSFCQQEVKRKIFSNFKAA